MADPNIIWDEREYDPPVEMDHPICVFCQKRLAIAPGICAQCMEDPGSPIPDRGEP